jgi:hypothetical protein
MVRGAIAVAASALVLAIAPGAVAAERRPKIDFDGAIELPATNGFHVFGLITSFEGKAQVGLIIERAAERATYIARGVGTDNSVAVDFGALGKFDLEVRPTGKKETLRACGGKGKPTTVPGSEFVGTIEFHGEEGFTEFSATSTPLLIEPLLSLVCGPLSVSGAESGGVMLKAKAAGGPSLLVQQSHPGAHDFYEATMHEKEGRVQVSRAVQGYLGAGALRYAPSFGSASFSAPSPFIGKATYSGPKVNPESGIGHGIWRGSLMVDFPGHAAVPIAGPGFKATILHAHRTGTHQ